MILETKYSEKEIFDLLSQIPDPEIPVINIRELGVLRSVKNENGKVIVEMTPTYSGCPALDAIEDEIISKLHEHGIENAQVKKTLSPAWTTDWLTDEAKEKLRRFGIAPPEKSSADFNVLLGKKKSIACPHCGSENTEMISMFGSTACKALYRCNNCTEPFDYFKCI